MLLEPHKVMIDGHFTFCPSRINFPPGVHSLFQQMSQIFTYEQVAAHNTKDDAWIIYGDRVFDVTAYLDEHPGGEEVIIDCLGDDATEAFDDIGHSEDAQQTLEQLLIGKLEGGVKPKAAAGKTSGEKTSKFPLVAAGVAALASVIYFATK